VQTWFIDTNILVYAVTHDDRAKNERAKAILRQGAITGRAAISVQVLSEFGSVTRRLETFSPDDAREFIMGLSESLEVIPVTPAVILEALRGVDRYGFAFYDAQLWAAARQRGIPVLLSEDFNTGSTIEGVTFRNPFNADFDMEAL
jgi:predicted nucleic acid-binding protein